MAHPLEVAQSAADALRARDIEPRVAVVLGSGWANAVDRIGAAVQEFAVTELPGFAASTVPGHSSSIRVCDIAGHQTLVFRGRVHLYEGHGAAAVVHGVRAAILAGVSVVVLTNACGSINPDFGPGTPVLIRDHVNLTAQSPLTGPTPPPPNDVRFVDMSAAYSPRLRALARSIDPTLAEGVYAQFLGPQYETPAEVRMAQTLGADLVGMSTSIETIAARHLGAEVLGISLATNLAAGISPTALDHKEVVEVGAATSARMGTLIRQVIERL